MLLFVLLALGVAGMHTFGHGRHAASAHQAMVDGLPHGMLTAPDQDQSQDLRLVAQTGEPMTDGNTEVNFFWVCLAVLGAFGLAVGLVLLRVYSHQQASAARPRVATHTGGRGPPVGLRVAEVSVLRI